MGISIKNALALRTLILLAVSLACAPLTSIATPSLATDGGQPASPTRTTAPAPLTGAPEISGCPIFPADNFWNTPVDSLPVHPLSDAWVDSIGRSTGFHMDFGSGEWDGGPIGIPFTLADASAPLYPFDFYYPDESDPGPYPIPENYQREWGSDHHILIVDTSTCTLYEIFDAWQESGAWFGGSGAIWDLTSNALRPAGWTSADAAGLPAHPARSGALRRDRCGRHQPCLTLHRQQYQRRHLACPPFDIGRRLPRNPAHGSALPPEIGLRHQPFSA